MGTILAERDPGKRPWWENISARIRLCRRCGQEVRAFQTEGPAWARCQGRLWVRHLWGLKSRNFCSVGEGGSWAGPKASGGGGVGQLHHSRYPQAHLIPGLWQQACSPHNALAGGGGEGHDSPLPLGLWENLQGFRGTQSLSSWRQIPSVELGYCS